MIMYNSIKPNAYFDSVTLMLFSSKIASVEGIKQAAVMMGTEHNKSLMIASGILSEDKASEITSNDLVVGMLAENQKAIEAATAVLEEHFENKKKAVTGDTHLRAKTLDSAFKKLPNMNFVVISLPGKYAKHEAMKAMQLGMHVLLFSDNVSVEEEQELKAYAVDNNLLMMGPDCGTAIINGVALGFANVVRRGNIGLIGASGTGLQEVTVIIDKLGGGISQAIGTGGRDLSEAIGGKMMLKGLEALVNDNETEIIGIISKPPAKPVMEKILKVVSQIKKPVVACFIGGEADIVGESGAIFAATLEDTASYLVSLSKREELQSTRFTIDDDAVFKIVDKERQKLSGRQKYFRGLYSGGTLSYESILILKTEMGDIYSNLSHDEFELKDVEKSLKNTVLDMGDDYFTDGMPHPMIDTRLRVERIKKEAQDPEVGVILLDCVLGYGCHENPAGALADAIKDANKLAVGRQIVYVGSVCGTDGDEQRRSKQEEILKSAGVVVMPSNAQAARLVSMILKSK